MHQALSWQDFQTVLSVELPVSYELQAVPGCQHGLLVLHGYEDRARSARRRLLGDDPVEGFTVLSPNALFPTPVPKGDSYQEAYAWYFRDHKSGAQMISPEVAAQALFRFIRGLNLGVLDWTILGFSQGGFFAPFLRKAGLEAKHLISVGASYRVEDYLGISDFKVSALHGLDDTVIPCSVARKSFEKLKASGFGDQFYELPGVGHTLDESGRKLVRQLLAKKIA